MPIEVYCQSCQKKLRVPDTAAGKRIKCPKCQGVITVPGPSGSGSLASGIPTPSKVAGSKSSASIQVPKPGTPKSGVGRTPARPVGEQWHVQTEDGQQYGPVTRQELDQWHADGRITVDTQLLKDGSEQWQWASDIYPDLLPEETAPASGGIPDFSAMASGSTAPASSAAPFDFSAGDTAATSVTARTKGGKKGSKKGSSRGKKKEGSPHIDYIAYAMYAIGGLNILVCLIVLQMGLGGSAAVSNLPVDPAAANNPDIQAAKATVSSIMATVTTVVCVLGVLMSGVYLAAGYGLQQRAAWGRMTAIVLGILAMPGIPVGTALGIWIWVVLTDKDNAAAFS